jgi:ABC-type uncharacterized transport system involved in gliding motility auxiliary subunit
MQKDLIILISGLVAFIGTILAAIASYLMPQYPLVWQITGGVAALALILYLIQNKFFTSSLSTRSAKYGLNSVVMSLVVLAIVIVVNMIASEHDVKKDVTKNQIHGLSEQSMKILKNLKEEVKLLAFVGPQQQPEFEKVFEKYTYFSKNLKPHFVDLDKDILTVEKYKVKTQGTLVFETPERSTRVENIFGPEDPKIEEKLTNALIAVTKGEKKKVYFTSGHGERLLSDTKKTGYSDMKDTLENSRFKVEDLMLVDKDKVPGDADLIITIAPKSDFMDRELSMLESYLRNGGKMLVMLDPFTTPTLKGFLEKFGIQWTPMTAVFETNQLQQLAGGNPLTPIVTSYDSTHEITSEAKQLSIFPMATPLVKDPKPASPDLKITSLFSSSPKSFVGEIVEKDKVRPNKAKTGPLTIGFAVSGKAKPAEPLTTAKADDKTKDDKNKEEKPKDAEFRLVVVGDADFASNAVRRMGINSDLFQNMLSWLSNEEDLIAIRPKPTDASEFEITEERVRVINLASMVLAPFGMFFSGIMVWLSRRRR